MAISNRYKSRLENRVSLALSITYAISNRYKTALLQFVFFSLFGASRSPTATSVQQVFTVVLRGSLPSHRASCVASVLPRLFPAFCAPARRCRLQRRTSASLRSESFFLNFQLLTFNCWPQMVTCQLSTAAADFLSTRDAKHPRDVPCSARIQLSKSTHPPFWPKLTHLRTAFKI
jgi:hypothetical protein